MAVNAVESESEEVVEVSEVTEVSQTQSSSSLSTVSLLERLKSPKPSELSRKRKVECLNRPATYKKHSHQAGAVNPTDPKNISPATRVKEFPDECLTVRSNKLFCSACREEVALKKSTVKAILSERNIKKLRKVY